MLISPWLIGIKKSIEICPNELAMHIESHEKTSVVQRLLLFVFGVLVCLIALEVGLRFSGSLLLYFQNKRNVQSIKKENSYRILCLGESTTAIGGKNSYPRQLENILNERDLGTTFSVINKGLSGTHTIIILEELEHYLEIFKPDMVLAMMGINDGDITITFDDMPIRENKKYYQDLRVYKLARLLRRHIHYKLMEIGLLEYKEGGAHGDLYAGKIREADSFKDREIALRETLKVDPSNEHSYINLARHLNIVGKYDMAYMTLKKAIDMIPNNSELYLEFGKFLISQEDYPEAEKIIKKVIEINPQSAQAFLQMGKYYTSLGEYNKANEMFIKSREINDRDPQLYVELWKYYLIQEKYGKAQEILKYAISIDPGLMESIRNNDKKLIYQNPITRYNYNKLRSLMTAANKKLVSVQYPMRNVEELKAIFPDQTNIMFVDNEAKFKESVANEGYDEYFTDRFGVDFGHCTPKGNRLLANNIADEIQKLFK